jgi:hypothetical protein
MSDDVFEAVVNPPGTSHTADVERRATALVIAAGVGTERRPRRVASGSATHGTLAGRSRPAALRPPNRADVPPRCETGGDRPMGWPVRAIYANTLALSGGAGSLPMARAVVRRHLERAYGRPPATLSQLQGRWVPRVGLRLEWQRLEGDEGSVWVTEITEARDGERNLETLTRVEVGDSSGDVYCHVRIAVGSTTSALTGTVAFDVEPPRFLAELTARVRCLDADSPLCATAADASGRDGADDVLRLLAHPRRHRPVLLVPSALRDDAEALAAALVGLAHVRVTDTVSDELLAQDLEHRWQRHAGDTVRVFWAGWTPADGTGRADVIPRWELNPGGPQGILGWQVVRRIYAAAAIRIPQPTLALRLANARSARRLAELQARADHAVDTVERALLEEYEADLRRLEAAEQQAALLAADNDRLREHLDAMVDSFAVVARTTMPSAPAAVEEPAEPLRSLADAVRAASERCSHLVFLDEAFTSAAKSPFRRPHDVYRDLVTLDEIVDDWRADALPTGGFIAACVGRGLAMKTGISQTAQTRYRDDYVRTVDGQQVMLGPHLCWGNGPPERHCRAYLWLDRSERRVVVGWVGRHLRDAHNA